MKGNFEWTSWNERLKGVLGHDSALVKAILGRRQLG